LGAVAELLGSSDLNKTSDYRPYVV
jgi:hypothetical protein